MSATARKTAADRKDVRNKMYGKIHAIWSALRSDLKKGSDDYKEALYVFAEGELKKTRISSFKDLTQHELSLVIKALEREQSQPRLRTSEGNVVQFKPKAQSSEQSQQSSAPVEHLASYNQRFAINRLFGYLGWSEYGREHFLKNKFRCGQVGMLTKKEAHSCIRILLNCAASRHWKNQGKEKVSKPMIAAAIPMIKRELGID